MDDFQLGKMGWFTVQNVEPNDFLNDKLENDRYGIYYSVKFTGDASTHLWQAKAAPVPGEKVYGHIELAKSGKSTRFKKAKKEDTPATDSAGAQPTATHQVPHDKTQQESIARSVALKAAVDFIKGENLGSDNVLRLADTFLIWLTNSGSSGRGEGSDPSPQATNVAQSPEPAAATLSGYEKARAVASNLRRDDKAEDEEIKSMMQNEPWYGEAEMPDDLGMH